jgi:DNA-binding response OmpR family regulator
VKLISLLPGDKINQVIRVRYYEDIWGKDDYFYGRSLDVFISRLRKYLSDDLAFY